MSSTSSTPIQSPDSDNTLIPFLKTDYGALELSSIQEALTSQKLEGNGRFTKEVHAFFKKKYGFNHSFFTPSGTDALELAALLLPYEPGDEIILPSYTFPSTAHAFALRGYKIVLADSRKDHPNIDMESVTQLVTPRTRAVCVVHYGGVACEMEVLKDLANKQGFYIVEDAAQAIDCFYKNKPLGLWGDLSAFSFHQTKNISCGEGGLLVVNKPEWVARAEIVREKGTNRQAFLRGEVDKYTCVDIGSSFVGSDLNAALLLAQLERMEAFHSKRLEIWKAYQEAFSDLDVTKPNISLEARHNAHNYYLSFESSEKRDNFIKYLKSHNISSVFHYVALHLGPYYKANSPLRTTLVNAEKWTEGLVRIPLFPTLENRETQKIIQIVRSYFGK